MKKHILQDYGGDGWDSFNDNDVFTIKFPSISEEVVKQVKGKKAAMTLYNSLQGEKAAWCGMELVTAVIYVPDMMSDKDDLPF